MTREQQLRIQASVDGELSGKESREVAELIAHDPEAATLVAELTGVRTVLKGAEAEVKLPESREFFWSKIQREIECSAPVHREGPETSIFAFLKRLLVPAGMVAALAIIGFIATKQLNSGSYAATAETVTELADAGAVTYHNYETSTTLVWFSYPSERSATETTIQ